jgi:hypothetical protein
MPIPMNKLTIFQDGRLNDTRPPSPYFGHLSGEQVGGLSVVDFISTFPREQAWTSTSPSCGCTVNDSEFRDT